MPFVGVLITHGDPYVVDLELLSLTTLSQKRKNWHQVDSSRDGAARAASRAELVAQLAHPRTIWLMLPAAVVDSELAAWLPLLQDGDTVIDGGNSYYRDDIRRGVELRARGIHYLDVGTSGGIWGAERGYCLMIGGEAEVIQRLDPLFAALSPGLEAAGRTPGRDGPPGQAEQGYLHCGPTLLGTL